MKNNEITTTQIQWIIMALNHEIASYIDEMDRSPDGSPIQAFGEIAVDGRRGLVTQLNDIVNNGCKTIRVI